MFQYPIIWFSWNLNQTFIISGTFFHLLHACFQVQRSRSHRSFKVYLLCLLCGAMPIWPIYFIIILNVAHTTHEGTLCRAPLLGQRSRSYSGSFEISAVAFPWLCAYLSDPLNMWHKYNPCVSHYFQVKGQGHTGHFVVFAPWIHACLNGFVPIWSIRFLYGTNRTLEKDVSCNISKSNSKGPRSRSHRY